MCGFNMKKHMWVQQEGKVFNVKLNGFSMKVHMGSTGKCVWVQLEKKCRFNRKNIWVQQKKKGFNV